MELRRADFRATLNNTELWRDVQGYEGLYKISYNGLVYSYQSDKYLRPGLAGNGYLTVVLYRNKADKKTHTIHTMLAKAFVDNPENKRCVDHVFGNKLMNHKAWLEWVDHKENNSRAVKMGLRKLKVTPEMISRVVSEHIKADPLFGAKALADKYRVNKSTIHEILNKYKYGNRSN